MKILVVDDDEGARLFLNRLLTKRFSCEVAEATNGLEALLQIQENEPDLVIMDIHMPIVNGVEMLEAIRNDPQHARLPVIVMSVVDDKHEIIRLIRLGISDYILKPLWSDPVSRRVSTVLGRLRMMRQSENSPGMAGEEASGIRVLVADKNIHFRSFFTSMLEGKYAVMEAATGAEALARVIDHRPEIICVGEGLTLFSETILIQKIRAIDQFPPPRVYLFSSEPEKYRTPSHQFDGILKKTFVPEAFLIEFRNVVLGEKSLAAAVREMLHHHLRSEIITAMQQTIGVMTMQEVVPVDSAQAVDGQWDVCASVVLSSADQGITLNVAVFASEAHVVSIAQKILGSAASLEEGAGDAFSEMSNVIGGRIRSSIEARGIRVRQHPPAITTGITPPADRSWELSIPFRTGAGELYTVCVGLQAEEN